MLVPDLTWDFYTQIGCTETNLDGSLRAHSWQNFMMVICVDLHNLGATNHIECVNIHLRATAILRQDGVRELKRIVLGRL